MTKENCKNCSKELIYESKKNLCQKCTSQIEHDIKKRDAIANPTAEQLDKINNEMNFHNTVYSKTGEN